MTAPSHSAEYWLQMGQALRGQQRWSEAADAFRSALEFEPRNAGIWMLLGMSEVNLNHYDEAEKAYLRALAIAPDNVETTICYSFLLNQRAQPQRAVQLLHGVLSRAPQLGIAWLVLGHSYELIGDGEKAEYASQRAVECSPRDAASRYQLANVILFRWQRPSQALIEARETIALNPQHADAWSLLGLVLRAFARHDESLAALRRAMEIAPGPQRHSKLLAGMQYADGVTMESLLPEHQQWNERYGNANAQSAARERPRHRQGEPLRLGFLSADFGQHPTGFFVLPLLENLDRQRCSIVCYADRLTHDDYTARFRAAADEWRVTIGMPDADVAELIRRDNIDVLFDLQGHFGERMTMFALKPAPVQITWFGYVGTTGLAAMDCLLADAHHVRHGEERSCTETVLRMPHGYGCYAAPQYAPEVAPLPALTTGQVTFGCFNNPAKFNDGIVELWTAILRRLPSSRLLLKYGWLGDPLAQKELRERFTQRGIAAERITIEPQSPHAELLATYGRVDIALDTQPYSGGLTTCEALWMGVPVITFPGKTFAGRHSTSHLTTAGYSQFIAADAANYVELAVEWAGRLDELSELRSGMREQVRRSLLCDAPRFAADLLERLEGLFDQLTPA